jgi:hypothetical protein
MLALRDATRTRSHCRDVGAGGGITLCGQVQIEQSDRPFFRHSLVPVSTEQNLCVLCDWLQYCKKNRRKCKYV